MLLVLPLLIGTREQYVQVGWAGAVFACKPFRCHHNGRGSTAPCPLFCLAKREHSQAFA